MNETHCLEQLGHKQPANKLKNEPGKARVFRHAFRKRHCAISDPNAVSSSLHRSRCSHCAIGFIKDELIRFNSVRMFGGLVWIYILIILESIIQFNLKSRRTHVSYSVELLFLSLIYFIFYLLFSHWMSQQRVVIDIVCVSLFVSHCVTLLFMIL